MGGGRKAALDALERCRREGAWSDAALWRVFRDGALDPRDRALAAALCYGVLQNRLLLDHRLQALSSRPLGRVEPKVLDILRLSAFQLMLLDRIPASAAVNEGVALCRETGFARAAGYVNAVLRALAAAPWEGVPEGRDPEALSVRYSHPLWLVQTLLDRLGPEETERLLRCHNSPAPLSIQVNTLKTDDEALLSALEQAGIRARAHPFLPHCLLADRAGDFSRTRAFRDGWFYIQDPAARFAVLAAAPLPGERVLDVCAAPGGKSFAAAIMAENRLALTACDLHENKLSRLREGAERLGVRLETLASDGRDFRPDWENAFDLVIADVPCSGLGVIRKKPDIRYKDPEQFAGLTSVQTGILRNVARYVRPGGRLLYSTCTLRREENEAVAGAFLAEREDFAGEDFTLPGDFASRDGMLSLWPHRQDTDGFFIAKLRKRS
ncbi:MAG: 16S rRNA (cytosine(967)-C(5))-methyltransferase RsmB [Oscillospiraceae bacterium]|nr:16S rRNA (cytosine(967)-C(5))-methyltransferase RsmB [Oscillospiraceae bacterium]